MKEPLFNKFQKFQRTRNELLRSLGDLSHEQLNKNVESEKWSIAQILYHIYISENFSLQYIKKKIIDPSQLYKTTFRTFLKSKLLQLLLWLPLKFKAPKVINVEMPDDIDWQKLLMNWGDTRDELFKFISNTPEEILKKKIFKHPRVGLINMSQALDFFQAHFDHHKVQVNKHNTALTKS